MDPELDFETLLQADNINAASALVEIASMSRVGILAAGADLNEKRATQMERDADRLENRGKVNRAEELRGNAERLREATTAMKRQREKEQIRPLVASPSEAILQGRATAKGRGKAGLKVSLIDKEGNVLARTISGANGAFTLKQKGVAKTGTIVIEDIDGKILGEVQAPKLILAKSRFVDLPVEKLKPVQTYPPKDTNLNVPKLVGLDLKKAITVDLTGLSIGEISLNYAPEEAGLVIKQTPEPDAPASRGQSVDLVVATGKEKVDFVTAQTLIRRDARIEKAGVKPAQITKIEKLLKLKTVQNVTSLDDATFKEALKDSTDKTRAAAELYRKVAMEIANRFPSQG